MGYKIIISPRALDEIENAIDFYSLKSKDAPRKFIASLSDAYSSLNAYPFYAIKYKNIRAYPLQKFPYSLYFVIDEKTRLIKILSCFHHAQNPMKRPKK